MTERPPSESSGLESGDPLRGEAPAPETPGYATIPPPGAGGPPVSAAPGALAGRHVLAGWWSRVGAALIDGVIVGLGSIVLLIAITAPFSIGFFANEDVGVVSVVVGLLFATLCVSIIALLYAPAMMARTNGQTLGRMALRIRVVRAPQPLSFPQCAVPMAPSPQGSAPPTSCAPAWRPPARAGRRPRQQQAVPRAPPLRQPGLLARRHRRWGSALLGEPAARPT